MQKLSKIDWSNVVSVSKKSYEKILAPLRSKKINNVPPGAQRREIPVGCGEINLINEDEINNDVSKIVQCYIVITLWISE